MLGRRAFKPEQVINNLRQAEVLLSQGATVAKASRKIEGNRPDLLPLAS